MPNGTLAGGVPDGMTERTSSGVGELAGYLGRVWPATREERSWSRPRTQAPDAVLAELHTLPMGQQFANLQEVWATLSGGHVESHRF